MKKWNIHFFASNSSQTPLNLISLTIFVTEGLSHSFNLKLKQLNSKKVLKKFALLGNYFCDFFTDLEIGY